MVRQLINAHIHIKIEVACLSVQPRMCRGLDNEFLDNEDPELNLVSLSKIKHSGYGNYGLQLLIRKP